jgi:hypothetical protein
VFDVIKNGVPPALNMEPWGIGSRILISGTS